MKLIEKLSDMIEDEIEGAMCYAKTALKYKDEYPDLSRVLHSLSSQEVEHMNVLHGEVVKVIERYRREQGEPPEAMMAVYDYLHDKQIEKSAEVKRLQSMY